MAIRIASPVLLHTRSSPRLVSYLLMVHGAAAAGLFGAALPATARLFGLLLVALSLARGLRLHGWRRGARATRALHWRADGAWLITDGTGRRVRYAECQAVLAEPGLILVRLRCPARRHWLVLAADSADADALRRLRVRLRRHAPARLSDQDGPSAGT